MFVPFILNHHNDIVSQIDYFSFCLTAGSTLPILMSAEACDAYRKIGLMRDDTLVVTNAHHNVVENVDRNEILRQEKILHATQR